MKRLIGLLVLLCCLGTATGLAQQMRVFFAEGVMERETAQRLVALLNDALPQAEWVAVWEEDTGESLQALVLSDRAPHLAVCAPREATRWAKEDMLAPLDGKIADLARMQRQVVDACTQDESLFMAPLVARHRQMAINRRLMEREQLGYLVNAREHPVWYPSEFDQILEEFLIDDAVALELWPPRPQDSAAMEALWQAIYGGALLTEDGDACQIDNPSALSGLVWLRDRVSSGQIGMAIDRETALEHFLAGKTPLFADWRTGDEARYARTLQQNGIELETAAYPSATGLPIRSFDLTGVCAFAGEWQSLAVRAAALLCADTQAQLILGDRALWRDDAVWLPLLDADDRGCTLRALLCQTLTEVLCARQTPNEALAMLAAAMEATP